MDCCIYCRSTNHTKHKFNSVPSLVDLSACVSATIDEEDRGILPQKCIDRIRLASSGLIDQVMYLYFPTRAEIEFAKIHPSSKLSLIVTKSYRYEQPVLQKHFIKSIDITISYKVIVLFEVLRAICIGGRFELINEKQDLDLTLATIDGRVIFNIKLK